MRQLFILIQKEFTQIFRNPFLPKLFITFPVMIMLVMPWVTTMDVRNVGVAIIDEDGSTLSRRISSDVRAAEYFTVNDEATTLDKAHSLLEDCEVDIILQIPKNFERNITSVEPEKLDISANAVNATKGNKFGENKGEFTYGRNIYLLDGTILFLGYDIYCRHKTTDKNQKHNHQRRNHQMAIVQCWIIAILHRNKVGGLLHALFTHIF